ncbi:hypothetical protein GCM10023237_68550 [Streptomyces coeruleoprunus]
MRTMTTETLRLPLLYAPFEPAVHPEVRWLEQRAIEWVDASGICAGTAERNRIVATRSSDFWARFVPHAADRERLLTTTLWHYWGFGFDDAHCDSPPLNTRPDLFAALAGRVQRALEAPGSDSGGERYIPALCDIAERMAQAGPPEAFRRFVAGHRAWLSGVTWQIGNQAANRRPGVDEYLAMRLLTSGGDATFAMWELATGIHVPGTEMHHPATRALTEMATMVAALDNDRHSLRKELDHQQSDQNIFTALIQDRQLTLQAAVHEGNRLRDRILLRFCRLRQAVRPRAGQELNAYLDGLCHGIRGNAEWGQRVPRYLDPATGPDGEEPDIAWAEHSADNSLAPLPFPSITWWWDRHLA